MCVSLAAVNNRNNGARVTSITLSTAGWPRSPSQQPPGSTTSRPQEPSAGSCSFPAGEITRSGTGTTVSAVGAASAGAGGGQPRRCCHRCGMAREMNLPVHANLRGNLCFKFFRFRVQFRWPQWQIRRFFSLSLSLSSLDCDSCSLILPLKRRHGQQLPPPQKKNTKMEQLFFFVLLVLSILRQSIKQ